MKIVFMGTPEFALAALKKLAAEHEVLAVYTKEPKVSGRGNKLVKTPVHLWAEEQGIEVRTPKTLRNAEEQAKFAALGADMSTFMVRCCRDGAARHRSSGQLRPATKKAALRR